jgi:ABC-type sugar transport system substrate-binding protein
VTHGREGLTVAPPGRPLRPGSSRLAPAAVVICALALVMSGCGGDRASSRSVSLAAVIKPLENPFFATMREGLVATAKQHMANISVRAALALQDTAGQASALESLIAEGATCYIVNPIDESNLIPPLSGVAVPIVNIDSPVDPSAARAAGVRITTYIGSDNIAAGRLAAQAMAGRVGTRARVAVIAGMPGDAGSMARAQGFIEGARGRFTIVGPVAADFDRKQAHDAALELIRGPKGIDGIFAVNDEMALGAVDAARGVGDIGDVAVIGMDGIPEALAAVRGGELSATVAQYPFTMAQLGVEACLAANRGKAIPPTIRPPIQLVTQRNAARAQRNLPRPVEHFEDPLSSLVAG